MTRRLPLSLALAGISWLLLSAGGCSARPSPQVAKTSCHTLILTNLSPFQRIVASNRRVQWVSPPLISPFPWNEMVLSWNLQSDASGRFTFEAGPDVTSDRTEYFTLGKWATQTALGERTSITGQSNAIGQVQTDVLRLTLPARDLRIRITWEAAVLPDRPIDGSVAPAPVNPPLKLLGIALLNSEAEPMLRRPNQRAWGIALPVPPRCQLDYPGGSAWCSPTALSMLLSFWRTEFGEPSAVSVPDIAREVFDPAWGGTGNWSFNVAYAGSLPNMRALVARLEGIQELEEWIAAGIPVAVSVSYSLLRGVTIPSDGHFLVCTGITETGDIRVNDPGSRSNPQPIIERNRFTSAWRHSHNTAYLVFPETVHPPAHALGHWE